MNEKKILYIYGWGSNSDSRTGNILRRNLPEGYEVHTFTYNQHDAAEAMAQIRQFISDHDIGLVIGSSLGGFLALLQTGVPRVVVNPCLAPSVELPLIGVPHDIADTYKPFEPLVRNSDLEDNCLVGGLFASDDELLGQRYIPLFDKYYPSHIPFTGTHRLSEENIIHDLIPYLLGEFTTRMQQYDDFMYNADNLDIYD